MDAVILIFTQCLLSPSGYTFQAVFNGVTFPVTIVSTKNVSTSYTIQPLLNILLQPPGGVKEGQKMTVPFTNPGTMSELTSFAVLDTAPHGSWKDGLCGCFKFGIFHPSLLLACCCPQILMGQILTRMRMNWLGFPAPEMEWHLTFRRIVIIVIVYYVLSSILQPPGPDVIMAEDGTVTVIPNDGPLWQSLLYNMLTTAFVLYTVVVLMRLRASVRARYEIPTQRCGNMEDCCCAFFCGCCTVSQLARQTTNYDEIRAVCCTDTGLPPTMQTIIV
jgi:Cys-rich protein (TIGR01571 family)